MIHRSIWCGIRMGSIKMTFSYDYLKPQTEEKITNLENVEATNRREDNQFRTTLKPPTEDKMTNLEKC